MKKKYAVFSGFMPSANDDDIHFISCDRLISLYGVDPRECVKLPAFMADDVGEEIHDLFPLRPHRMGKYEVPEHVR